MISLSVTGTLSSGLKELTEQLSLMEEGQGAMDDAGDLLANLIRTNLRSGRTPWGQPFKPLAQLTINTRFRGGKRYKGGGSYTAKFARHMSGSHTPLNDTGQHIANRITSARDNKGVIVGLLDNEGNKIGRVHQFGAIIRAKNVKYLAIHIGDGSFRFKKQVKIPARPFMPILNGQVILPGGWATELYNSLSAHLRAALTRTA